MTNHLKRIAAPASWLIDRRSKVFVIKPLPSGHALRHGLPLGVVLRDILGLGTTMTEIKKVLNHSEIAVDGRRRKDPHYLVGLFDVITVPSLKKTYFMAFDKKGRMMAKEAAKNEGSKLCKIMGKTVLGKNKIQLHLHDGKNVLSSPKAQVGDSVLIRFPSWSVEEVLPLRTGAQVYLTGGKHQGEWGMLKEIKGNEATYAGEEKENRTLKQYLFVIPKKHAVME